MSALALFLASVLSAAPLPVSGTADQGTQVAQSSVAATDPSTASGQATVVDDVQVTARRQAAYNAARTFLEAIVETPPGRGLARWDGTVCVGVANMRADIAQPLIDRISDNVASVGLAVGEPGCQPNVLIVATNDGAGMARALVDAKPRAFNPGVSGTRLTLRALERFQSADVPVRWWRITLPVDADTGALTVRLRGEEPQARAIRSPSRLRSQDRNVFSRVFVILDLEKAGGMNIGALGDYIAMAALAQVDLDADVAGYATILNLFSDPTSVQEMSDWDRDYLRALYTAELNELRTSQQIGTAAGAIARQREAREAPAAD